MVHGAALGTFTVALLVLTVFDVRTGRLPDRIVLPCLWVGLLLNSSPAALVPASDAIVGAAAGYAVLRSLGTLYELRRTGAAFGRGDMKLSAMIGAWLGVGALPSVLLVAFVSGTAAVVVPLLLRRLSLKHKIPFGPALAAGGALTLLSGPSLFGLLSL